MPFSDCSYTLYAYLHNVYLTEDIMKAQSLVFFHAGFSTTSITITIAVYVLAARPDIQERLRKEMDPIIKSDGSLDYDELGQLVYMDMFISEVLRHYGATNRLERLCVRDYKDPESGLFVPKGAMVIIPLNGIHHDKRYYERADEFYQEHFSSEKKATRSPYVYMPFGFGPRGCVGMRFPLVETKAAIARLVHNFRIEPTPKTPLPVQVKPAGFQVLPPTQLELKLTPIRR